MRLVSLIAYETLFYNPYHAMIASISSNDDGWVSI